MELSSEIDPITRETMRERGIRFECATAGRMDAVMAAFVEFYVDYDPCWRATGFWDERDSLFYRYALWEARAELYKVRPPQGSTGSSIRSDARFS